MSSSYGGIAGWISLQLRQDLRGGEDVSAATLEWKAGKKRGEILYSETRTPSQARRSITGDEKKKSCREKDAAAKGNDGSLETLMHVAGVV